jgi:hypothetical protein
LIATDFDRDAMAVIRIDRVIAAAPERPWQWQTGIADRPEWQKGIETAKLEGGFMAGNTFTWTTAGLAEPIASTIFLVEAKRSILWGGPSAAIAGIHRWIVDSVNTGMRVTTEESRSGAPIEANRQPQRPRPSAATRTQPATAAASQATRARA